MTVADERVQIELPTDVGDREAIREYVTDVVGEDDAADLRVTTEAVGDESDVRTVVSFRRTG